LNRREILNWRRQNQEDRTDPQIRNPKLEIRNKSEIRNGKCSKQGRSCGYKFGFGPEGLEEARAENVAKKTRFCPKVEKDPSAAKPQSKVRGLKAASPFEGPPAPGLPKP